MRFLAACLALGTWLGSPAIPALAAASVPQSGDPFAEFEANLSRVVERYPTLCRRSEIGRSRSGRPIWALSVSARPERGRRVLPTVLVLPALDDEPVAGARLALDLAARLAAAQDGWEGRSHLSSAELLFVPAPDPDGWFPRAGTLARRLDRNFPVRWDPWLADGSSPGPYPLSEPESRALADLVLGQPEIGAAVLLTGNRRGRLARELERRDPGSLAAFLDGACGIPVLASADRVFADSLRGARPDAWTFSRAAVARLPRLVAEPGRLERLAGGLWQLDVSVRNVGGSATAPGPLVRLGGGVRLRIEGARLARLGQAPEGGATSFELVEVPARSPRLAPLDAGEGVELRLWLRASEGDRAVVEFTTPRAAPVETEVELW